MAVQQHTDLGANDSQRQYLICGDMNAQVGACSAFDDPSLLGPNGFAPRTARGELLVAWCSLHGLVVGNSFSTAATADLWTYRNGATRSQLDYILINRRLFLNLIDCCISDEIDIGSDHRAVAARFSLPAASPKPRKQRRKRLRFAPDSDA